MEKRVEVLIEALPYIRKFKEKVFVVKVGGAAVSNEKLRKSILQDCALLKFVGIKLVLVHGGGPEISKLMEKLDVDVKFVKGLRHTSKETLDIVRMALGKLNSEIVEDLEGMDCKALGTTGKSGGLVKAARVEELGLVGKITKINPSMLEHLLDKDYLPVIQPLGADETGKAVNINADELASSLAKALKAEKLIFLTNVPGLLEDLKDESTLVREISTRELKQKLKWEEVSGGMIPKTKAIIDSIESGTGSVHLLDGRKPHSLLLEIFTTSGVGTMITK